MFSRRNRSTCQSFKNYLQNNSAALVISRNVTVRDRHDRQQPFNLKVAWPTSSDPNGWDGRTDLSDRVASNSGGRLAARSDFRRTDSPARPARGRDADAHDGEPKYSCALAGQPSGSFKLGDDGSFAAIIPARKALTWHLLNNDAGLTSQVKERFWVTFQPGEVRTCANCHGINTADQAGNPKPTNRAASTCVISCVTGRKAVPPFRRRTSPR